MILTSQSSRRSWAKLLVLEWLERLVSLGWPAEPGGKCVGGELGRDS